MHRPYAPVSLYQALARARVMFGVLLLVEEASCLPSSYGEEQWAEGTQILEARLVVPF